ncbi:MAG: transglutaminase family protein [Chloroflexi bacterium]|nr:transglutaminase family protein [Chloroflexota bacterium]
MADPIRYRIEHESRYTYAAPARYCVMRLCLKPGADARQRLLSFDVATEPAATVNAETDAFGNTRHLLNLHRQHQGLAITAASSIDVLPPDPVPEALDAGAWPRIRAKRNTFADWEFTRPSALTGPSPALAAFVRRHGIGPLDDPLTSLRRLTDTLHRRFTYSPGSTSVISPIDHILETGHGVCQDYAHVMIAIARSWGIPTRYVSGYLHVTGADGEQAPETATHAWAECRLPGLGWIGFDPTNQTLADQHHVRVAVGRDYHDVSPTRGIFRGATKSNLTVNVRIRQQSG